VSAIDVKKHNFGEFIFGKDCSSENSVEISELFSKEKDRETSDFRTLGVK
jgi:hypothetical protein